MRWPGIIREVWIGSMQVFGGFAQNNFRMDRLWIKFHNLISERGGGPLYGIMKLTSVIGFEAMV